MLEVDDTHFQELLALNNPSAKKTLHTVITDLGIQQPDRAAPIVQKALKKFEAQLESEKVLDELQVKKAQLASRLAEIDHLLEQHSQEIQDRQTLEVYNDMIALTLSAYEPISQYEAYLEKQKEKLSKILPKGGYAQEKDSIAQWRKKYQSLWQKLKTQVIQLGYAESTLTK